MSSTDGPTRSPPTAPATVKALRLKVGDEISVQDGGRDLKPEELAKTDLGESP